MVNLSVVIPVYNGATLLPRCLDAIVAQQTHYEMEVWLVDDGSTDDTVALYRERYLNVENPLWQSRLQFHLLQQQSLKLYHIYLLLIHTYHHPYNDKYNMHHQYHIFQGNVLPLFHYILELLM